MCVYVPRMCSLIRGMVRLMSGRRLDLEYRLG